MSRQSKGKSPAAGEKLPDCFKRAVSLDDKPDTKDFHDLGSPVSPLRPRGARGAAASSSSSSSGSVSVSGKPPPPNAAAGSAPLARRSHSGELSGSSEGSPTSTSARRPTHRRSGSSGSASSLSASVLPTGNICPAGMIAKAGSMTRPVARRDVLGYGTGHYGHGSVVRADGNRDAGRVLSSSDPEELSNAGNEKYKRGEFEEALGFYDRAVAMCPAKAACRSNKAAALTALGRLAEAIKECEEAVRIEPAYARAHQRLASLLLRVGQIANARRHLNLSGQLRDPVELRKLQTVEQHLARCEDARRAKDWKSALRETDAAIAAGADSSPLLFSSRAEALLRLHHLEEADQTISNVAELENSYSMQGTYSGMQLCSYILFVRSQVEMAMGRFNSAVTAAEKARQNEPRNLELVVMANNVKSAANARARGNDFYKAGSYDEACISYGEGLRCDPSNPVLHCNRAACRAKLGQWERSVEDCNEALRILPKYTKALLRRAACNTKLERWAESVRDYEALRKELPGDNDVAEGLFHAQVALKASRGEDISNLKFGGEVEHITGREQFKEAISLPGVSVVYFMDATDQQCIKLSLFVDSLCSRHPSLNFLKVNVKESRDVARDENVLTVPTFKIYKDGIRVKEMIHPNQQMLENSLRHYII